MEKGDYVSFTLRSGPSKGEVVTGRIEKLWAQTAYVRYFHNGASDARWFPLNRLRSLTERQYGLYVNP